MKAFGNTRLIGAGILLLGAAIFILWPFRFSYDSVCSQCGAIQNTTEWQLPFSRHTIFKHSTIESTPLSRYLTTAGIISEQPHQWLFGHGGGNGIKCALGDGDNLRATVTSPETVRLLRFSRQFGEPEESAKFLTLVFDRNSSHEMVGLAASVPTNGFSSSEQYHAWVEDQRWFIDFAQERATNKF
jgi:hypothetical protein